MGQGKEGAIIISDAGVSVCLDIIFLPVGKLDPTGLMENQYGMSFTIQMPLPFSFP